MVRWLISRFALGAALLLSVPWGVGALVVHNNWFGFARIGMQPLEVWFFGLVVAFICVFGSAVVAMLSIFLGSCILDGPPPGDGPR